jgi:hypothetical protein
MNLFSNWKPLTQKLNKGYYACGLEVLDGLSVTLPINVCHCDIRESMRLLDPLSELAVVCGGGD